MLCPFTSVCLTTLPLAPSLPIPLNRSNARVSSTNCPSCLLKNSLQSPIQSSTPTHPWRCLCFGFNEQIIYTCPFPFFPPFLLTDYINRISLNPSPLRTRRRETYLTPLTKLLHRTPNLHPPNLLHRHIRRLHHRRRRGRSRRRSCRFR